MAPVRKRAAIVVAILAFAAFGFAVANHEALLASALPEIARLAGYDVRFERLKVSAARTEIEGLDITRGGDPVLSAARVEIAYSLRDLLPGSAHRYGLRSVVLDRPSLTLVRHRDGTYNIPLGGGPSGPQPPSPVNHVPLAMTLRVLDGTITIRAPDALDPAARTIAASNIDADATIDQFRRTHYTVRGAFVGAPDEGFTATGTVDVPRGYAMHHIVVQGIPLRAISNYFINSDSAHVLGGSARNIDARVYALDVRPNQPVQYHVGANLDVKDVAMSLVGLDVPIVHMTGRMQLVDGAFFTRRIDADLAGIPVRIGGGIYDFASPQYRFGIRADGSLGRLRHAFAFMRSQQLGGSASMRVEVDGPLDSPTILAQLNSPLAVYDKVPLQRLHAVVAYRNGFVYFVPLEAHSRAADFTLLGMLRTGSVLRTQVMLHMNAPADSLPYAGELMGKEPLVMDVLLDGHDTNFYAYGAMASTRGINRASAVVHMDPRAMLDVAPLHIDVGHGTFDAAYHLDRQNDRSAFWIVTDRLRLQVPEQKSLFAPVMPSFPPMSGIIDRASIVGGGHSGNETMVAGTLDAHAMTIAGVKIERLRADLAGTMAGVAIDPVYATGPWGELTGVGRFGGGSLAVRGIYHGTLEGLRPFMQGIPASGRLSGIASLAVTPSGIDVQAENLRLTNADVRGIPIERFSGTLAVNGGTLHILSAHATVANGDVVAAGTFGGPSGSGGVALVANGLSGAQLRRIGLPLDAGRVDASGLFAAGSPLPSFRGGVALANGRVQRYHMSGSSMVALQGDGVRLSDALGNLAGIYTLASGDLTNLVSGTPSYTLHADVPAADIATMLHALPLTLPTLYSDGTFDAALDVRGSGLSPHVTGPVGVPAGSVNGLSYVDARGDLDANPSSIVLRRGSVEIGRTNVSFAAGTTPRGSGVHVRAPDADLSDFNDFFDTGDTLNGKGSIKFDVISQKHRISTNGNLDIGGLRYRNLGIGDTRAIWSSRQNTIKGTLAISGMQGSMHGHGTISVVPSAKMMGTLRDSRYDLAFGLRNVDLSHWIAALGFPQIPATGRVDADATINGRYPNLNLRGSTSLTSGSVWRLPIESARLDFRSVGTRLAFDHGYLVGPGLTVTTSGSVGLHPADPISVRVYANSNDLPGLVAQLWRFSVPVSGDYEATLTMGGTLGKPTFSAAFDATDADVYGLKLPLVFGSLDFAKNQILLRDAGIEFEHGEMTLAGSVPFTLQPLQIGPRNAPVSFDLAINNLDPGTFDTLLDQHTKFSGSIDGALGIDGTVGTPRIAGRFGITNGSYVSDLDRAPISDLNATLAFNQTRAAVERLSAKMGSGTISGSGSVVFPNGFENVNAGGAAFDVQATARAAQVDSPTYGRGSFDGIIKLSRVPGHTAMLTGNVTLNDATLPFAAFVAAASGGEGGAALPPLALGFNLNLAAGRNVTIRGAGYGAGLDIGAAGSAQLTGSIEQPSLDGEFHSTGGTLTYFDRAFRVQQASVTFNPENGIIPTLHAKGITHVFNPDTDIARNPYGSADVTISVDGPIDNLKIGFSSNPPGYTNEQILAMIAPFGGLISGVPSAQTPTQPQIPGGTLQGPLYPAGTVTQQQNGTLTVGQEAFNILNAQFSAGLLSPFENTLQQALGLQSIALNVDYYGNVGVTASRLLGRTASIVYGTTFGLQNRQTVGFQVAARNETTAQLSLFFQNGPQRLFETPVAGFFSNGRIWAGQPLQGQSGFSFTLQRLYW
jgi:hypothetical protein